MKLTNFFNVNRENLPGSDDWVEYLLGPLNSSLYGIWQALNQNLTIGDNLIGQTTVLNVSTSSTYSSGQFTPVRVPWNFAGKQRPVHVLVTNVTQPSSQPNILNTVSIPSWTYEFSSGSIQIPYIAGLADSRSYQLTLLIL